MGGGVNPVYTYVLCKASDFGFDVEIADELRRAGDDEEQVFDEAAEGAEQVDGLLLAVGSGAVALCGVEERRVIRLAESGAQQDERVLAAGEVNVEVEVERAAYGSFGEARGESAVSGFEQRATPGEQGFKIGRRDSSEAVNDGAGADGGQKLLWIFGEQDERCMRRAALRGA